MDGIAGKVPAPGPSGWQGGESFSNAAGWKRVEADSQMKTPCMGIFQRNYPLAHVRLFLVYYMPFPRIGEVAQLVEHHVRNVGVESSNLFFSTILSGGYVGL